MKNLKKLTVYIITIVFILTAAFPSIGSMKYITTDGKTEKSEFETLPNLNVMTDNQLQLRYSFKTPIIKSVVTGNTAYNQIIIDGTQNVGDPNMPNLPVKGAYILLPQNKKVQDIIVYGEKIFLGSDFNIPLNPTPIPTDPDLPLAILDNNQDIYNSKSLYPNSLYTEVGTYCCRGYMILVLQLHPIQYIPYSGELFYYNYIDITVTLSDEERVDSLIRNSNLDKQLVMDKVDNPLILETYTSSYPEPLSSQQFNLLIITIDSLKNDFEPLAAFHNGRGVKTAIKTLTDIGSNDPTDIRDYIRNAYEHWGTDYVLIGGDSDIIPVIKLWVRAWSGGPTTTTPSDLYYACLNGPYNYDGDSLWGEPNDGTDGGDVDLMAEVYIGRACVGNSDEVNHFVDKTIAYMNSNDNYLSNVLMTGEKMDSNPTWGGDSMDHLIDGSSAHGYTTVGIPSNSHNISVLYDRNWPGHDWPDSEIISRINNGVHIINHMGHSDYGMNMKMYRSDVTSLTNDNYCFVYSQGCNAGGFDKSTDCIAESFTIKTDHGAFAGIWNARSGWYNKGSTNGPSQRFHRQFWDAIFGENIEQIGRANQDSKEDILYIISGSCIRWCYYQLNLFGDPTLVFNSVLEISNIQGGIGVSAKIKNNGMKNLTDVDLEINITGGILGTVNKTTSKKIDIKAGADKKIRSGIFFGLGVINIKIRAGTEIKTVRGMQILIFTLV